MKRIKNFLLSSCLVVLFTLALPLASVHAAGWVVVPSQNPGPINVLNGVAWNQTTNVQFSVGYFQKVAGPPLTLTERWNGAAWIVVPSPNQGLGGALNGVTAQIGAPPFWAVGYWITPANVKQTLTEMWNGGAWVIVPSPNIGGGNNVLNSVSWDQTTKTAWAVGYFTTPAGLLQTLIEHWNGAVWNVVPSPNQPPGNNVLNGVAVNEITGQAQAVGYWTDAAGVTHTLTEIWAGGVWNIVPSPNKTPNNNRLNSVAWIPATKQFWAVGSAANPVILQTLILQWNGGAWVIVPSPNIGVKSNALNGVAAAPVGAPFAGWAVGYWTNPAGTLQTLTEGWNGGAWVIVGSPNVGPLNNVLNAVSYCTPNWNAAAVGYSGNNTLAELF